MSATTEATFAPIDPSVSHQEVIKSFDEMGIPDSLLRGIYAHGFEVPSAIQQRAIKPMINGKGCDLIAQAQSGTGKTGTFCIGTLSHVDPTVQEPQVLVLSPTRELAQQTFNVASAISSYMGVKCYCATGGPNVNQDIDAFRNGAQFIIGTPGRIYDLLHRGKFNISKMKYVILDEADQMLEDRFREQVHAIMGFGFPKECKIGLFSATMPPACQEVASKFLVNPTYILIPKESVTLEGIHQYFVKLPREDWKFDVLCDIYKHMSLNQLIIFVNRKTQAQFLAERLSAQGHTLQCIHGDMEPRERKECMDAFRRGDCRVLISTDLLARGIDVQQVSLVINYELPPNRENYIHRIGRSGRYGRKGVAINIITDDEERYMNDIMSYYHTNIDPLPENLGDISASVTTA